MAGVYRNAFCLYVLIFTIATHVFLLGRHGLALVILLFAWALAALWIRFGVR
jgi:hypothetical protein